MRNLVSSKQFAVSWRNFLFSLLPFTLLFYSCGSIPNLESPECTESRNAVREFYSFHFGNEMRFSPENLKVREKFLTPQFFAELQGNQTENDVFTTNNTDFPKAFRVGKCEIVAPEKIVFEILLFWRDDTRSEERKIKVEIVRQDGKWLVNKVLY